MLRSVPMVHMRVQLPGGDAAAATRAIASEGLLHLVDIAHGSAPYDASPPGTRELYAAFRDLSARITAVAGRLGIALSEPAGAIAASENNDFAAERERIALTLEPLEKRADELLRKESAARETLVRLREASADRQRIRDAAIDPVRLSAVRFATIRLGVATAESLESLSTILAPAPFALVPLGREGDDVFFAAAIANFAKARLEEAFRICTVRQIAIAAMTEAPDLAAAEAAAADAKARIDEEKEARAAILIDLARRTETATLLLQAQTFFAAAGRFIVISGWVPETAAEKLRQRIATVSGGRAVVDIAPAESMPGVSEGTLRVPILHRNPLVLRPFQKLIEIYGTPSYEEVEPTAFFAISFLLMFGLMFGDVGHGLVLTTAGFCLFRYMPRFLDYGILLMEAGASSTFFGFLYGSIFGVRGLLPAIWLEPIDDLSRFMTIAVALGVVVVSAGLVLNIVNAWRTHDIAGALTGPKGLGGALLYWVALVLVARAFVPVTARVPAWVIASLFVIAFALLFFGGAIANLVRKAGPTRRRGLESPRFVPRWLTLLEGSVELVDTLFSFFANTISFVRVAAFAAVHAGIFIAIFALADTIAHRSFGGVLSIAVHVAGNALMILLEGLTVSVQVLRLEYYEFFGKFFRGGGEIYHPLTLEDAGKEVRHG